MGGFSAVLGNPPFLGGSKISGTFGHSFRNNVVNSFCKGAPGKIDLCTYFLLNSNFLCHDDGFTGLILTNTISQGENSELGIKALISSGYIVCDAVKNIKWQGDASVIVSSITLTKTKVNRIWLDGVEVSKLDHNLNEALSTSWSPLALQENKGMAFSGTYIHGNGFFISNQQREMIEASDPKSLDVVRRHLGGKDLNTQPDLIGSRWVLDFGEMDISEARKFTSAFQIIEKQVKPHRQKIDEKTGKFKLPDPMPRLYWQYWRTKSSYYSRIRKLESVIAIAQVSNTAQVAIVDPNSVLDAKLIVFCFNDFHHFGILSSSIHLIWGFSRCTTMKNDFTYTPSTLFETFPFSETALKVAKIAEELNTYRNSLMISQNIGLTKVYNKYNSPENDETVIEKLRDLHRKLDEEVLVSYGWNDIPLEYGFNDTGQGIRYFPSKKASREILTRLTLLNKKKFENGG